MRALPRRAAALAAILVTAAAVAWAPPLRTTTTGTWRVLTDRSAGWSIAYPTGWRVTRFSGVCQIGITGVMVADVPGAYRSTRTPAGCSWPPRMTWLPADAVVVEFDYLPGGPVLLPSSLPDTSVPLRVPGLEARSGSMLHVSMSVQFHRLAHYTLNIWIGPAASPADRATARAIIASIRPANPGPSVPGGFV